MSLHSCGDVDELFNDQDAEWFGKIRSKLKKEGKAAAWLVIERVLEKMRLYING